MTLYAFQLPKPNESKYVGAFNVFQLQPNLTVLKPAFRVRQDDVDHWNAGSWRLRTLIPSSFASTISGLESELTIADELLVKQQSNLDTQSKLVEDAKQQRDGRLLELLGGGNANAAVRGLVAEITEADDLRNASLFEVDHLRREISAAEQHIHSLIRDNNELANTLQARLTPKQTAFSTKSPYAPPACRRSAGARRPLGVLGFPLSRRSGKPYHLYRWGSVSRGAVFNRRTRPGNFFP